MPAALEPAPPEPSDEALIARTAAGDRAAFDALAARRTVADRFAGALPVAAGDLSPEGRARLADAARPPPRR